MALGIVVATISGSPRFLLAKEAWITAAIGVWFLLSARSERPLSFVFARAALEGRDRFTPRSWAELWRSSARFRRGWRISALIWGLGLLVDAAIRVLLAYTLPVDTVPALNALLFPLSLALIAVVDQLYQQRSGMREMILGRDLPVPSG